MSQGKELKLITGVHLLIDRGNLLCYDAKDAEITLTQGQELLLKKLADHVNHAVPMSDLYEAYSGDTVSIGDTRIRDNIAKKKKTCLLPSSTLSSLYADTDISS